MSFRRFVSLAWLPLLALLVGCMTTPPSRFYVLTAQSQPGEQAGPVDITLGVGPVRLVPYLERPQIVARESGGRLRVEEFERWGGALESSVIWVTVENLSRGLGIEAVIAYPWERAIIPDYQLVIDIGRFDAEAGRVRLVAQWRILGDDGRKLLSFGKSDITESLAGPGFDAQVAAQSRALAGMSDEISQVVRTLQKRRN